MISHSMPMWRLALISATTWLLVACQSTPTPTLHAVDSASTASAVLSTRDAWTVAALHNHSVTDTAGDAASALLGTHLQKRGVIDSHVAGGPVRYALEGSVLRWHYIGGASPQPSVAVSLAVRDLHIGERVWSSSISDNGRRHQSLTSLADQMLGELVARIPLTDQPEPSPRALGIVAESGPGTAVAAGLAVRGRLSIPSASVSRTLAGTPDRNLGRSLGQAMTGRSVAFYYAANPPIDVLSQFDRLVLEADNIKVPELTALTARGARAYAYVSVGEVGPNRAYAAELDASWVLGRNPAWNSQVLDLSNAALRDFLLKRVGQLQAQGYGGVFLDTMDSFNLVVQNEEQRLAQQNALVQLIEDMAARYPALKIITNRGFEVLEDIAPHLEAVAAESLYAAWNNTEQRYTPVPDTDREWLLAKLDHARKELRLDVIAIDYLPPARRDEARQVASAIAAHGFIPWVANPELDYVGIGALEVLPRKVLMLYDSRYDGPLEKTAIHKFVATPVEYLGYVPEYLDVSHDQWPAGELKGRYAGIVTWPSRPFASDNARPWLQKQLDDAVPVAFLSMPPVALDATMSQSLGVLPAARIELDSARLVHSDDMIKPERSLSRRIDSMGLVATSTATENSVHMSYEDRQAQRSDVVVTGPFGGFAWQPGLVDDGLDYETYWVLDPFKFLQTALQLPDAPMPDVTSENGKRLWLAHIDGDALPSWAEMPGAQLGAEVIYERILKRYPLPHTVSVVESEMTEFAAYNDRRQRMFDIARKTFRLDHVELASHTYSHPFKWAELGQYRRSGKYNLPLKGYVYTPQRDIAGSIDFIDRVLAPPGKRSQLMLWSGDALPRESDLAVVESLGLPNMNGGLTFITRNSPSLTLVSPMARPVGSQLQVYAPVMNENLYTNDWLGPFDGFKRVIETFQMTETPRRLKPVNIYYHFYSGTKIAAVKALQDVYDWTVAQDIHPVFASTYARKVPAYRRAGVARYLDGRWKLSGLGQLRSIRWLGHGHWPDLVRSQGITGAKDLHDAVYVHTDGADVVEFGTRPEAPRKVHLVSSNGRVVQWNDDGTHLRFRISAQVPVSVELGGAISRTCTLDNGTDTVTGSGSTDDTVTFTFTTTDTGDATLNCPA